LLLGPLLRIGEFDGLGFADGSSRDCADVVFFDLREWVSDSHW